MKAVWARRGAALLVATGTAPGISVLPAAGPGGSAAGAQASCPTQTLAIPPTSASPNLGRPEAIAVDSAGSV